MKSPLKIKQALYGKCLEFVDDRLNIIHSTISEIQESLNSETKSSAGDKHETGRAMLQLEREKAGNQLMEIEKTKQVLSKINIQNIHTSITLGSLVYTSKLNYFIAISAGEINIENERFYAISASTPIAKLLLSKTAGEQVQFLNDIIVINKIE